MTSPIPTRPELRTSLQPGTVVALTLLAMAAVWAGILIEPLRWIWGVLLGLSALAGMRLGETLLVGRLRREEQPALFWFVSLNWLVIGVLWALYP